MIDPQPTTNNTQNLQPTTYNLQPEKKGSALKSLVVGRRLLVSERGGFTLVEIVITVAIMAAMLTASVLYLSSYSARSNISKTLSELDSMIVATQKRSITQDGGYRWNVRVSNTTSSGSQFMSFSGLSFSTSTVDRTFSLSRRMQFSEPASGFTYDFQFAPLSGMLTSRKVISIVDGRRDGFVGDLILSLAGLTTRRVENGLVGYWHFDENSSSTVYDAAGMGNSGVLVSSPTWQTGANCVSGSCLSFNGTGAYVDAGTGSSLSLTNAFTIASWINPTAIASVARPWFSKWVGLLTRITSPWQTNVYYYLQIGGATREGSAAFALPAGQWSHLVETYDSATHLLLFYLNGAQVFSVAMPAPYILDNNATSPLHIGNYGGEYFNGSIDEFRVYNRALSATEVANMYNDLK